jgi:hypothetical protein
MLVLVMIQLVEAADACFYYVHFVEGKLEAREEARLLLGRSCRSTTLSQCNLAKKPALWKSDYRITATI